MQKIITIHIYPLSQKVKAVTQRNCQMKFGQLIDYNIRNAFLEKSHVQCGEDLFLTGTH